MLFNLMFLTVCCLSQAQVVPSTGTVRELPAPNIAIDSRDGVYEKGEAARIECRSPGYHLGSTFYLKRDGEERYQLHNTVPDGEDTATFDFVNLTMKQQGNYRCFYSKKVSGIWKTSTLSNTVQIIVRDNSMEPQSTETPGIKAKAREHRNDAANLWTTFGDNISNPQAVNNRSSFRFSQDLQCPRDEDEGIAYYANHSTEFLNDTQLSPRGLNKKPYFVTFREQ
uniref:uncharacterized protein isoform X3 n=1 Tax=Pristiophorus japonicus TaxID=55135 RepID=UPI00398EAD54